MWLAGWAVRTEPARGILSDLLAKALAIEDDSGSRLVLLTLDLIAVSRGITNAVAEQVERSCGLPRERVMVFASHTHSGPEVRPDKVPFFHIPAEYARKIEPFVDSLIDRLVSVVNSALVDLRPARFTIREAATHFAHNRRGAAAVDRAVPVLEAVSIDGGRRAVVFGYACHNATLPPTDGRYSGDYAGFAQASLEATGSATAALFIAGAGADLDPEPRGTVKLAQRHGEALADAVRAAADPTVDLEGQLRVAYAEVMLEFQRFPSRTTLEANRSSDDLPTRTKAEFLLARLVRGEPIPASYACPIQVARFGGGLMLVALGGEPVVEFAHEIKRRYGRPGRFVWVAGYANEMFGYLPTAGVLRAGGYEGTRSLLWSSLPAPFTMDTDRRILEGVDRLVRQLDQGV
jgi:hypothetical protein